jgi:RimJ/RimL family protein N-acetyltransferase
MAQRPYAMEFYKDPQRFEGTCPVCNMLYVKELAEDRRIHRAFHRSVVDVFEPKPSVTLAKLYSCHGQLVPVRWDSPQPLRRRLASLSRVFKREFGCDFTMYSATGDPGDGYLVAEPDGRAVGGFVVRWIEYSNAPAQWMLSWVWIAPTHRRRGLMRAAWLMAKDKYPGIDPDPPFSKGAAEFFANRDDLSERIRKYAQGQLAADSF